MNINQHNCSLSDATMAALFIHPDAATKSYTPLWLDLLCTSSRCRSGALTPIALSQWTANEQLKNRIGKKEERKKAGKQIARPQAGLLFCLLEFSTAGLCACVWLPSLAHFSRAVIDTHTNTLPLLNHNTPRDSSCYPRKSSAHSSRRAKKLK